MYVALLFCYYVYNEKSVAKLWAWDKCKVCREERPRRMKRENPQKRQWKEIEQKRQSRLAEIDQGVNGANFLHFAGK